MKNKTVLILSYVLVALLASSVTLFFAVGDAAGNYSKLEQLEDLIADKFIGEADRTQMEDAAANAMVDSLGDQWSYYISAKDYAAYMEQMNNAYVGVGITITVREDGKGLDVVSVTQGGPAEAAGLCSGDIIVAVAGNSIVGKTTEQVRDMIRGKENTAVEITVLRQEKELTVSVMRKQIQMPVATGTLLDGGIGLVTIENFDARCADETIAAIESLLSQGADKLIFDVRFNPGGYKDELVKVLDYLVPAGLVFRSEYYDGTVEEDRSDAKELNVPMVVLVNDSSYSAAEFFAAALRDYDKAVVVGQQTVGKGYFQSTFQLKDGSAVGLSIGKYYTPKGENLANVGITPDVSVEVDETVYAQIYYGLLDPMEDPQILAAIQAFK